MFTSHRCLRCRFYQNTFKYMHIFKLMSVILCYNKTRTSSKPCLQVSFCVQPLNTSIPIIIVTLITPL
ncbi:hypothetical protein [Moraxella lacunata]|uniref:hypothetical protein n=1 Tax=Moraxella lacunata TaxID=477 RepID=UPI003EE083F5